MRAILLVVAVLLLAGCTQLAVREFNAWAEVEKPRAKRGEIPWSQFYTEAYSRLEKAQTISGKAEAMDRYSRAIQAAQFYESGKLTKDEFEAFQRTMDIEAERQAQTRDAASRRAMGDALKDYGNTVYGPAATQSRQMPSRRSTTTDCVPSQGGGFSCTGQ